MKQPTEEVTKMQKFINELKDWHSKWCNTDYILEEIVIHVGDLKVNLLDLLRGEDMKKLEYLLDEELNDYIDHLVLKFNK